MPSQLSLTAAARASSQLYMSFTSFQSVFYQVCPSEMIKKITVTARMWRGNYHFFHRFRCLLLFPDTSPRKSQNGRGGVFGKIKPWLFPDRYTVADENQTFICDTDWSNFRANLSSKTRTCVLKYENSSSKGHTLQFGGVHVLYQYFC